MSTIRLDCTDISSGYSDTAVVSAINISVWAGECVALLGRNGVGKTSVLRTIAGLIGAPYTGSIRYEGNDIGALRVHSRAQLGIAFAPDDRAVFRQLSVSENLSLARRGIPDAISDAEIFGYLPGLEDRGAQLAGQLSGGEQQMLSLACTLLGFPPLILLDEPSEGLSEGMVGSIETWLHACRSRGSSLIVVDQRLDLALRLATRCYVMDLVDGTGSVVLEEDTATLRRDKDTLTAYLSV